ncbi:MAG: aminotransferase class IV family protein [Chitinophagaceae bacterium]|nr:aminotransferase class IV family protein [Chitinophagaceae bacterium]
MFITLNGKCQDAALASISAEDRSYRYGDGLFETMKYVKGEVQLAELHFDRLFRGAEKMAIEWPKLLTREKLVADINEVCKKNKCTDYGRIRLSVSAGQGGLFDPGRKAQYCIEAWPLSLEMAHLNSNGLTIGIYPEGEKSCDSWSNLKSSSFLIYSMAAVYAKNRQWNDALVVNTKGFIADSCIANLFIIKNGQLITPALTEACVEGVMRNFLLQQLPQWGYSCDQRAISPSELEEADEVFLTNAIRGIRWVGSLGSRTFGQEISSKIYQHLQTIWK